MLIANPGAISKMIRCNDADGPVSCMNAGHQHIFCAGRNGLQIYTAFNDCTAARTGKKAGYVLETACGWPPKQPGSPALFKNHWKKCGIFAT